MLGLPGLADVAAYLLDLATTLLLVIGRGKLDGRCGFVENFSACSASGY